MALFPEVRFLRDALWFLVIPLVYVGIRDWRSGRAARAALATGARLQAGRQPFAPPGMRALASFASDFNTEAGDLTESAHAGGILWLFDFYGGEEHVESPRHTVCLFRHEGLGTRAFLVVPRGRMPPALAHFAHAKAHVPEFRERYELRVRGRATAERVLSPRQEEALARIDGITLDHAAPLIAIYRDRRVLDPLARPAFMAECKRVIDLFVPSRTP